MSLLSRYLLVQYAKDTLALFTVALALVWSIQMLRLFDIVTAKGQGLITLAANALLTTPPLAREIVFICMAVGLARAFKALQNSRELHSIHIMQRVPAIWGALVIFAIIGALFVSVLAHWLEPTARHTTREWQAQIAAELVGQALVPGRFTKVSSGVVVQIGGRQLDGTIVDFFADDRREPELRRTYFADSATIVQSDDGYQISLRDGRLQVLQSSGGYSEIEFARYELAIDSLTESIAFREAQVERPTWVLLDELRAGPEDAAGINTIIDRRYAEALRVLAICLLVAAIMSFPHARRERTFMPAELLFLIVGVAERFSSNYVAELVAYGPYFGPVLTLIVALVVLAVRAGAVLRARAKPAQQAVPA